MGMADKAALDKADLLLKELGIGPEYRKVVPAARAAAAEARERADADPGAAAGGVASCGVASCGAALELPSVITSYSIHYTKLYEAISRSVTPPAASGFAATGTSREPKTRSTSASVPAASIWTTAWPS